MVEMGLPQAAIDAALAAQPAPALGSAEANARIAAAHQRDGIPVVPKPGAPAKIVGTPLAVTAAQEAQLNAMTAQATGQGGHPANLAQTVNLAKAGIPGPQQSLAQKLEAQDRADVTQVISKAEVAAVVASVATPVEDERAKADAKAGRAMARAGIPLPDGCNAAIKTAFAAEYKKLHPAPKEAPASTIPAAPVPAPAAQAAPVDPMRARMRTLGMSEALIDQALGITTVAAPVGNADSSVPADASVVDDEPESFETAKPVSAAAADDEGLSHDDDAGAGSAVALQNQWSQQSGGAIQGDVDESDFKTPQLKIVQGSGLATINWNQGDLVFCDQLIFGPPAGDKPSPVMRFIPVSLKKYFRENLAKGSQLKPRNLTTKEEVTRVGGTLDFTVNAQGVKVKPNWSPAARIVLLIEKPENVEHPGFTVPIEIGGVVKYFAAAVYFVNGGAYRSMAKPIIDATNFILRDGDAIVLHKRVWSFQTTKVISGENTIYTPAVRVLNELTPAELGKYAEKLLGHN